jgi:DNA-binding MarR family transcriptional regulator
MSLGDNIMRVCRTSSRLMARRVARWSDRTYIQLRALRAIAEEGIETQVALAERLMMDAPSVSRLVARLEKDGLVVRREGEDRRCVRLSVTEAASPELAAMARAAEWLDAEVRRHLTEEERATLEALLVKLRHSLHEICIESSD